LLVSAPMRDDKEYREREKVREKENKERVNSAVVIIFSFLIDGAWGGATYPVVLQARCGRLL